MGDELMDESLSLIRQADSINQLSHSLWIHKAHATAVENRLAEHIKQATKNLDAFNKKFKEIDQRLDNLTQELDQPVMSVEEAETDLVKSNLCNEPRLASDVLSLCVSQLITKEEARRLMGFKS